MRAMAETGAVTSDRTVLRVTLRAVEKRRSRALASSACCEPGVCAWPQTLRGAAGVESARRGSGRARREAAAMPLVGGGPTPPALGSWRESDPKGTPVIPETRLPPAAAPRADPNLRPSPQYKNRRPLRTGLCTKPNSSRS